MDPASFKEFLLYFPHDRELCVLPLEKMIFDKSKVITEEGECVFDAIYDDDIYKCIVVMVSTEEISEEVLAKVRESKKKLKLSSLLKKFSRVKPQGRLKVQPTMVSRREAYYIYIHC